MPYYENIITSIFLIIRAMGSLNGFRYLVARGKNFEFLSPMLTFFPLYNATSLVWDEYCHLKVFIHWNITMHYIFDRVVGKQGLLIFQGNEIPNGVSAMW